MSNKPKSKRACLPLLFKSGLACLLLVPELVLSHAGEKHEDAGVAIEARTLENTGAGLPIDVGGPFTLTDHNGNSVSDQSFAGKHMLVFFGYTDCQIMCSISLTRIGDALEILHSNNDDMQNKLAALVVTVDPENDTPDKLKKSLAHYHPTLLGLTGSTQNLTQMYQAYNQSPKVLDDTLNDKDVVTHTSYFYLMGPDGELETLFPPILNAESMANVLAKYIL